MTLVVVILLTTVLITWPALYFAEKYLDWPTLRKRRKWFPLALILPLGSALLLQKYGGLEWFPTIMAVLFVFWLVSFARAWLKTNRSGVWLRLGRSRYQR